MGCQCSQATSIVPQQPHPVDLNHPEPQVIQVSAKKDLESTRVPQKQQLSDKENLKQRESTLKSHKDGTKGVQQKWAASETKIKAKSEKRKSEVPIIDSTNIPKNQNPTEPKQKVLIQEKVATTRSEYKIDDQPSVGPSSKSIEFAESSKIEVKEGKKTAEVEKMTKLEPLEKQIGELVEVQEIKSSAQIHQNNEKTHIHSKRKIKSVKQVHQVRKVTEKLQKNNFVLEEWQKGDDDDLTKTERLKKVEEMQIEKQEVCRYLEQICDYEKQILKNVIDQLQLQQHKKYQQPLVIGQ